MLSDNAKQLAISQSIKDMKKEVYDSCQSLEYETNSVFNSNGQTPFITFNFGQSESFWGREIQKSILQVRLDGLGAEKRTAVFPKLVFTLKNGLNLKEGDPNYDIKQLALECASKRIYPDILSYDKLMEIYGYFISPMGCTRGDEVLHYTDSSGSHISSIEELWNTLANSNDVQIQPNGKDEFIDVSGVTVADSHSGEQLSTNVSRIVKNYDSKWVKVVTRGRDGKDERVLYCTTDHPLPVQGKGRVFAGDLVSGDVLTKSVVASWAGSADENADLNNDDLDYAEVDKTVSAATLTASLGHRLTVLDGITRNQGSVIGISEAVVLSTTNKTEAYSWLMLAASLEIASSVREEVNEAGKLKYIVNVAKPTDEISTVTTVYSVETVELNEPSYDVTTDSDYFDISGIVSHNCRSFLPRYLNAAGEEMSYGRRNVGVCTLNLPNIAMSTDTIDDFFDLLDVRIQLVFEALMYRYDSLAKVKPRNAPILYSHGATGHKLAADANVQEIFKNGEATASMGYIGLHETALRFFGDEWQDSEDAREFTVNILKRMVYWQKIWADETGIAFSTYGTPAESLTDRFCKVDRETFGDVRGITDKGYYTNSFHLDVAKKVDPFTKIDFEAPYPHLATGGHIVYVEQPSLVNNLDALEAIWDYAYDRVPYFGVNQPISRCLACDFEGDFDADVKGFYCPECSNRDAATMEVVERMCGYLSTVSDRKPVHGRIKEITARVKHMD